ncbi:F0F1 ATP synthase subunit B family protein [Wolbachia endosymbiont of Howardula sp.]|uniref:F0F1 ATP synthase subunit B family protein n=1 Tax=Wolbachia endosymbiont of Howardula sp. TaxID=2916816 RepID=UPI00217ED8D7|nr:hypothetical protein [Wolbachia endosymbiont of Howardula sp.]UWI83370.1 hypothetical protein MC061_01260 [Wolbachia endosymbiont of Howardula sp.]
MPQLDLSTFSSQIFWLTLSFLFMYSIISYIFLPKLEQKICYKNNMILESFNNSLYILFMIEHKLIKYNLALQGAHRQAKKILNDAFDQIDQIKSNLILTLQEQDKATLQQIHKQIEIFKSNHSHELQQIALAITSIYYSKLTDREMKKNHCVVHFIEGVF